MAAAEDVSAVREATAPRVARAMEAAVLVAQNIPADAAVKADVVPVMAVTGSAVNLGVSATAEMVDREVTDSRATPGVVLAAEPVAVTTVAAAVAAEEAVQMDHRAAAAAAVHRMSSRALRAPKCGAVGKRRRATVSSS